MSALRILPKMRRDHRGDSELLAVVARGDLSALGELYDRHHRDVWRVLHRVSRNDADVDDLVQATFVVVPRVAHSFVGDDSCRGWLCGIAVRLAARQRRSLGRWLRTLASFTQTRTDATTRNPERDSCEREELRRLAHALEKLSAKKRDVFVLVELEGVPVDVAASTLALPPATVRTRLFHARSELREAMKRGDP